jgi:hypothetical protein
MHWSEFDGILFIEETVPEAKIIEPVQVKIHGVFSQAQLKNLNDVKRKLSSLALSKNGNAIVNFQYGQQSTFWTTVIGVDDVNWYGRGYIARIPQNAIEKIRGS